MMGQMDHGWDMGSKEEQTEAERAAYRAEYAQLVMSGRHSPPPHQMEKMRPPRTAHTNGQASRHPNPTYSYMAGAIQVAAPVYESDERNPQNDPDGPFSH
eukprot:m.153462 g.153462  ORF g.153462 m.153462 type:complete len:100 (-) comp14293_c0_seq2:2863-3162(-)